jgi:peroxiredoxin
MDIALDGHNLVVMGDLPLNGITTTAVIALDAKGVVLRRLE